MARCEEVTTLCYMEKDDQYLMMHRISKERDVNKDKWIGVGGHFETFESPEECIKREIYEETGLEVSLSELSLRSVVTFATARGDYELMFLFTCPCPDGELKECDEGELSWVKKSEVSGLNLWAGDRIFLRLLDERKDFFSLKLMYDEKDNLTQAILDGKEISI